MSIWQTEKWWKMILESKQAESVFDIWWIQVEKRSLWLGQFWLFIIWLDYTKDWIKGKTAEVEEFLVDLAIKENVLFIQIEVLNYSWELKDKFFDLILMDFWFYKKFLIQYTAFIDLTQTEEEILAWMKPKGRYNIKLATKKWIKVIDVDKTKENIELFYDLITETTARDNFNGNSIDYYTKFLKLIDSSKLLLAHIDWTVIAWWIFTYEWNEAIYYYWASTSKKEYRNLMAPYLIQWEAIKIGKINWSKLYDFLWVAPPWLENHPLSWVTDFKLKFTKNVEKVSESYIFVRKPFIFKLLKLIKKIKSFIKKLKSKLLNKKNKTSQK